MSGPECALSVGYDLSSGRDFSAVSIAVVTPGCDCRVIASIAAHIPREITGKAEAEAWLLSLVACSMFPRLDHLSRHAKKFRARKKNARRIAREFFHRLEQERGK